jgi:chromosomal replication initiation ATPase DnaA
MDQLWKDVLAEIEVEVSQPIYLGFFRITSLVEKNGSVATINVATPIARRYIEERYYSLIKKILDKKTGENMSLVFTSDAAPKP